MVAVVGGKRTDTDCLACATLNWYLVTCEVAVVVADAADVDADAAAGVDPTKEVVVLVMDVMKEAVDEILLQFAMVVADDSIETLVSEKNSIPATRDAIRTSVQDSQCQDDLNIRKEACQDDQTEVMLYCRALEVVSCCCCYYCLGCLDSE